jgi:hypothetical protein
MTDTSKALLAASIRVRMFAKRDTIDEALNYAIEVFDRVNGDDRAAVYTVLHVVLNTVADKIDALPDSSAAALEPPPAEVRIDHADLPATGAPLLSDQISDIVDQRIKFQLKGFDQSVDRRIEESFNQLIEDYDLEDVVKNIIRNMSFSIDVD